VRELRFRPGQLSFDFFKHITLSYKASAQEAMRGIRTSEHPTVAHFWQNFFFSALSAPLRDSNAFSVPSV
jgi:hypothetical protein